MGSAGLTRVELWGTRDGGRTWKSFALDDDKRSPMLVRVAEEGLYGFSVVASGPADQPGRAPASGESPQVLINVDLTKPNVRIQGVRPLGETTRQPAPRRYYFR